MSRALLLLMPTHERHDDARLWLQELFPHLYRYHEYLHGSREDPETGLVYVYHPWETEIPLDSAVWYTLLNDTRQVDVFGADDLMYAPKHSCGARSFWYWQHVDAEIGQQPGDERGILCATLCVLGARWSADT